MATGVLADEPAPQFVAIAALVKALSGLLPAGDDFSLPEVRQDDAASDPSRDARAPGHVGRDRDRGGLASPTR
jgi:hypothetical protein